MFWRRYGQFRKQKRICNAINKKYFDFFRPYNLNVEQNGYFYVGGKMALPPTRRGTDIWQPSLVEFLESQLDGCATR